jgi:hypothetical protein
MIINSRAHEEQHEPISLNGGLCGWACFRYTYSRRKDNDQNFSMVVEITVPTAAIRRGVQWYGAVWGPFIVVVFLGEHPVTTVIGVNPKIDRIGEFTFPIEI